MNSKMDSEMEDEDVYVAQKYVGQIMPFHESFEQVNAEVGMKLETTNILCERFRSPEVRREGLAKSGLSIFVTTYNGQI